MLQQKNSYPDEEEKVMKRRESEKPHDWPIGKVATEIILFTRSPESSLVHLIKLLHENVKVINPAERPGCANTRNIKLIPTVIFMWNKTEIDRIELSNITG